MNGEDKDSLLRKAEAWSKIVSTLFIASASVGVTWLYNSSSLEQQRILKESELAQQTILTRAALKQEGIMKEREDRTNLTEALREFIPHLVSTNDKEKKTALLVLDSMGYKEFVLKFSSVDKTRGSKEAGDILSSRTESTSDTPIIKSMVTSATKELGWVYLGEWNRSKQKWESKYFDFEKVISPTKKDAIKQPITVSKSTSSINIRVSPPNTFGELGNVSGILYSGSKVRILEIKEWYNSGYMWARVEG